MTNTTISERMVTVCDKCLTAQCWHAGPTDCMCEDSQFAGTKEIPARVLDEMARQDRTPALNGPLSNLDTFALERCWLVIERMLREHGNLPSPPIKQGDEGS